jgi:hypothetical protein
MDTLTSIVLCTLHQFHSESSSAGKNYSPRFWLGKRSYGCLLIFLWLLWLKFPLIRHSYLVMVIIFGLLCWHICTRTLPTFLLYVSKHCIYSFEDMPMMRKQLMTKKSLDGSIFMVMSSASPRTSHCFRLLLALELSCLLCKCRCSLFAIHTIIIFGLNKNILLSHWEPHS